MNLNTVVKQILGNVRLRGNTDNALITNTSTALDVNILPTYKTFVVTALDVVIGNNKSMLSITNATGSGVIVRLQRLYLVNSQTTAVTGVVSDFKLFRIATHSVGTSITPLSHDTNDTLSGLVTARTGSTVASEGANPLYRHKWSSDEWGVGTDDVESNAHNFQALVPFYYAQRNEKPLTLRENEGISLKHVINSTSGSFDIIAIITESTR